MNVSKLDPVIRTKSEILFKSGQCIFDDCLQRAASQSEIVNP